MVCFVLLPQASGVGGCCRYGFPISCGWIISTMDVSRRFLAILSARQLRVMLRQRHAGRTAGIYWSTATALALITHLVFCDLPSFKFYNYISSYRPRFHGAILSVPLWNYQFVDLEHTMLFHAIRRELPPGLSITAQNNLGYFFLRTHRVYSLPGPKTGTDVYIFDTKTFSGYDTAGDFKRMEQFVGNLLRNPNYQLTFQRDGILIFSRIRKNSEKIRPIGLIRQIG